MCPQWSPTPASAIMLLFYCNLVPQQQHLNIRTWDFDIFPEKNKAGGSVPAFNAENRDSDVILIGLLLGSLNPLHSLNSHKEKIWKKVL